MAHPHTSWWERAEELAEKYPCYAILVYLFILAEVVCVARMLAGGG